MAIGAVMALSSAAEHWRYICWSMHNVTLPFSKNAARAAAMSGRSSAGPCRMRRAAASHLPFSSSAPTLQHTRLGLGRACRAAASPLTVVNSRNQACIL